ncbi:MAG: hypothetical protein AAFV90_15130 [Cyanobacteria bacterium J06634_5]
MDQALQLFFTLLARGIVWLKPHLPILCGAIAWALPVMILWNLFALIRSGVNNVRRLHRIPCAGCCYATHDHRLKCSVHPVEAFSEDAVACRDFEPNRAHEKKASVVMS